MNNELWFCWVEIGEFIIWTMFYYLCCWDEWSQVLNYVLERHMWYDRLFFLIFFERLLLKTRKSGGIKDQHLQKSETK